MSRPEDLGGDEGDDRAQAGCPGHVGAQSAPDATEGHQRLLELAPRLLDFLLASPEHLQLGRHPGDLAPEPGGRAGQVAAESSLTPSVSPDSNGSEPI